MARLENAPYMLGKAKEQLERAAELNPLSPYVYQSLATAYWIDGNKNRNPEMFQKALDAELRASENFPLNPEYHRKLVQIYKSLEMKERAQEHAQLAKELQKHFKKN
jgi:tetratricopeptide (TPR) repeat protein